MNNSIVSKYIPLDTVIHNLDPRTKLFFVIVYLVDIFIAHSIVEFSLLISILAVAAYLSKTSYNILLSSVKSIVFLIVFTSLVHLFFNKSGSVLLELSFMKIYSGALIGILLITVRFILVVMIMVVFMATTSPSEITHAIEKSLGFLKAIGIPISIFALVLSISLRFIPTIRGSDFNEGSLIQKVKKFIPILIPLFIATLKRADELATAMEVRGYSTTIKRSKYKRLKYESLDYLSYLLIIAVTAFIVLK